MIKFQKQNGFINFIFEFTLFKAEKDAASSIPPLRDLSEASTGVKETEVADDPTTREPNSEAQIQIFNYDKDDLQTCKQCKLVSKYLETWQDFCIAVLFHLVVLNALLKFIKATRSLFPNYNLASIKK